MTALIIVDHPEQWPLKIRSAEVVSADAYLREPRFSELRKTRVFNLCDSYRYQSVGYYVSLLATARGHRAMPSVTTIQDMKSRSLFRPADDLEELIERSLRNVTARRFELSIYFGRSLHRRQAELSHALFNLFPVPLMRASFVKSRAWRLVGLAPIPVGDLPSEHRAFLHRCLEEHFIGRGPAGRSGKSPQYEHDLAILVNEDERSPPSNREALKRFERAARGQGFDVEFLARDDYGRLAEFDALFIRETTSVNHHTYRFASRARSEGLVVIDDPSSITRCGNKVYLFELARRLNLAIPPTMIASRPKADEVIAELGLPCVLKQPDSAFSEGVFRADTREQLEAGLQKLLSRSDLAVVQSFLPTEFDWRVGILDREPLYVCRYFMAAGHWQIYHHGAKRAKEGESETLPVDQAPREVVELAQKAANAIGDGLYGVDVKTVNGRSVLIEVNDNPNVDRGVEDAVLGDALYEKIMKVFRARVDAAKRADGSKQARAAG
ncbi:MAG TPA: RimK family protein [Gammaproteobacteria bacterium]|nr:RimK family protein [Gammaproteobacteria bacterium]